MSDDKFNHSRYLDSNTTACEEPDRLGDYPIVLDYGPGKPPCNLCYALVFAYNDREYKKEIAERNVRYVPPARSGRMTALLSAFYICSAIVIILIVVAFVLAIRG